jgi:hypothetical protein
LRCTCDDAAFSFFSSAFDGGTIVCFFSSFESTDATTGAFAPVTAFFDFSFAAFPGAFDFDGAGVVEVFRGSGGKMLAAVVVDPSMSVVMKTIGVSMIGSALMMSA